MIRMCARNYQQYTHRILSMGIVREPTVWGIMKLNTPAHNVMILAELILYSDIVPYGVLRSGFTIPTAYRMAPQACCWVVLHNSQWRC